MLSVSVISYDLNLESNKPHISVDDVSRREMKELAMKEKKTTQDVMERELREKIIITIGVTKEVISDFGEVCTELVILRLHTLHFSEVG